ncbi:MAG: indole-3-glycerol phosphate synthase TrpC [Acidimicrobiia bacterium]|nr:indole-3-glycerol phosphate synthase TrpC [Acidimicrobiia bacterium]
MSAGTYLDRIVAAHRAAAVTDDRSLVEQRARAAACPPTRGFARALAAGDRVAVIAEVKRRSPSKGDLNAGLDPAALGAAYAAGGAACLSVLTDVEFFGGSPTDLAAAREASGLPVLRKDFTVSEHDVLDARLMGADAVLLIAAALSDAELGRFHDLAEEVHLDVLVEVHDEHELKRALRIGPRVVGVNQRDLVTFAVDTARAVRVAPLIPQNVLAVAESGIIGAADAEVLAEAGYQALLVGETLVRAGDPSAAVDGLRARRRQPRPSVLEG